MASSKVFVLTFALIVALAQAVPSDNNSDSARSCGANEDYIACEATKCYKSCSDLVKKPPCPSVSADCNSPACVCKEGYLRNEDGVCVRTNQCLCSGKNEVYNNCAALSCYKTCKDLKTRPACPEISAECYEPACLCEDGYYRNDDGVCVLESQC